MSYVYNLDEVLSKDLRGINILRGQKIFVCIYEILFKINSSKENPFLQYLMYKYQKT